MHYQHPPIARTGVKNRDEILHNVKVSSMHVYNKNYGTEDNMPSSSGSSYKIDDVTTSAQSVKRCVYKYDDRFKFTRILTDDSLLFDSHFESGNLHTSNRVLLPQEASLSGVRLKVHTYELYMQTDINTSGHTQWFYYRVNNMKSGQIFNFKIKNFRKSDSMFKRGMKPLVYSTKLGYWTRACTNIIYHSTSDVDGDEFQSILSDIRKTAGISMSNINKKVNINEAYFTLDFTYSAHYDDDICYFACCYPYTYSDLQHYLHSLHCDELRSKLFRRSLLCKTIAGNRCDILTITSPCRSAEELLEKPIIFLSARIHPGESNSSFIMHGILDFLTDPYNEVASILRQYFIFKIVPMINPDGVINGNYRTSLSGHDLNRKWKNPEPMKHVEIYTIKERIKRLQKRYQVSVLIDLHGHSIKRDVFVYGCLADHKIGRKYYPKLKPMYTISPPPCLSSSGTAVIVPPTFPKLSTRHSSICMDTEKKSLLDMEKHYSIVLDMNTTTMMMTTTQQKEAAINQSLPSQIDIHIDNNTHNDYYMNMIDIDTDADSITVKSQLSNITPRETLQLITPPILNPSCSEIASLIDSTKSSAREDSIEIIVDSVSVVSNTTASQVETETEKRRSALDVKDMVIILDSDRNSTKSNPSSLFKEKSIVSSAPPPTISINGTNTTPNVTLENLTQWKVRLLPSLIGRINPVFSYQNCSFTMQKSKAGSLRLVSFFELGLDTAYTMEASLAGYSTVHFNVKTLVDYGHDVCRSLFISSPSYCALSKVHTLVESIKKIYKNEYDDVLNEIVYFRQFYNPKEYFQGLGTLSDRAMMEFATVKPEQYKDDSDDDSTVKPKEKKISKKEDTGTPPSIPTSIVISTSTHQLDSPNHRKDSTFSTPEPIFAQSTPIIKGANKSTGRPPLHTSTTTVPTNLLPQRRLSISKDNNEQEVEGEKSRTASVCSISFSMESNTVSEPKRHHLPSTSRSTNTNTKTTSSSSSSSGSKSKKIEVTSNKPPPNQIKKQSLIPKSVDIKDATDTTTNTLFERAMPSPAPPPPSFISPRHLSLINTHTSPHTTAHSTKSPSKFVNRLYIARSSANSAPGIQTTPVVLTQREVQLVVDKESNSNDNYMNSGRKNRPSLTHDNLTKILKQKQKNVFDPSFPYK